MATPTDLAIDAFDPDALAPGLHRFRLRLDAGAAGGEALPPLPARCWRGATAGPRLVVVSGVHGDEGEGPAAIRRLEQTLAPLPLRGSLVALPHANPWAVAAGTRATPERVDGLNLARVFPGDPDGRPTERLADALFRLIRRLVGPADLLADLHSGGAALAFLPVVGWRALPGPAANRGEAAARAFGLERIWRMAPHAGTLTDAANRAGVACLGAEMTGAGGPHREDVDHYVGGVRNLLRFLHVLTDRPPPATTAPAHAATDLIAPVEGELVNAVGLGDRVAAGQPLGAIRSPRGDVLAELDAPHEGQVWAQRRARRVAPGDLVAMIAAPTSVT